MSDFNIIDDHETLYVYKNCSAWHSHKSKKLICNSDFYIENTYKPLGNNSYNFKSSLKYSNSYYIKPKAFNLYNKN